MKYREFQKILRKHSSFNIPENTELLANPETYYQPDILTSSPRFSWKKLSLSFSLVVFSLFIALGIFFQFSPKVQLTLDINPSMKIELNRFGRVISVLPLDDDTINFIEDLDHTSGSLEKVLTGIYQATLLSIDIPDPAVPLLFGVSGSDFDTEIAVKNRIVAIFATEAANVLVIEKHTEINSQIYSGYAVSAESSRESFTTTSTQAQTTEYMTTIAAYTPSVGDSVDTTEDELANLTPVYTLTILTETEFSDLAAELGITEAKLQIVLLVFSYYDNFRTEGDLALLADLPLSVLMPLYAGISN